MNIITMPRPGKKANDKQLKPATSREIRTKLVTTVLSCRFLWWKYFKTHGLILEILFWIMISS